MSSSPAIGIVITCAEGREENLQLTLESISRFPTPPSDLVVVFDGWDGIPLPDRARGVQIDKYEPGRTQPRNVGYLTLTDVISHAWFVDSDIILTPGALDAMTVAARRGNILIGPYDWLPEGAREPMPDLHNDPRWPLFDGQAPSTDVHGALACFGGNIVYSTVAFDWLGGYHPRLLHGRCEDGELGLRALQQGIGVHPVPAARGWHLWHPRDLNDIYARNARDVPIIQQLRPWINRAGLHVVEEEGRRLNWTCENCGESINSNLIWSHQCPSARSSHPPAPSTNTGTPV